MTQCTKQEVAYLLADKTTVDREYKELFPFFDGIYDINEAIRLIKRNSRRFAKRQLTWFRKDNSYIWVNPSEIEKIIETIEDF